MENEKEGWIVFGEGDNCIAVPASVGMEVISKMVIVNAGFGGRISISPGQIKMNVITSDAMTTMRVKYNMLGKAKAEAEAESAKAEDMASAAMELKMKQMQMMEKARMQKMKVSYDLGQKAPGPLKLSSNEPLTRNVIKTLLDPDEKF